jgi:ferrous iron transport protein A
MTAAVPSDGFALPLDELELGTKARVVGIDWDALDQTEANRLKHFGFDEGVAVEALHLGPFGRDPIAIRVGRMTVAIRRRHAGAVRVLPLGR